MNALHKPELISIGGVFIDDIVFPDGRTQMDVLGGGSTHAAAGMRVWGETVGLLTTVGQNLSVDIKVRLKNEFDIQGFVELSMPQARAWQLFEWDGKRTELPRVEDIQPFIDLPDVSHVPETYKHATGVYLLKSDLNIHGWRHAFEKSVLFWEPIQQFMIPENAAKFRDAISVPDVVSPNLLEAGLIYGAHDPDVLIDKMLADGAKVIALRMGAEGSMVASPTQRVRIPAVPVDKIIDQTGAGNTYCGGWLAGWIRTGDLKLAGCYGAVSASFALEQIGVIKVTDETIDQRDQRMHWLETHMI